MHPRNAVIWANRCLIRIVYLIIATLSLPIPEPAHTSMVPIIYATSEACASLLLVRASSLGPQAQGSEVKQRDGYAACAFEKYTDCEKSLRVYRIGTLNQHASTK